MIFQTADLQISNIIFFLIIVGSCLSVPIAHAMQDRQRRRAAQILQQVGNNPSEIYPDAEVRSDRYNAPRGKQQDRGLT